MEKSIITTGKTIDDAVEAALAQLGLTRDDVSYQVISLPKSGFFGIGATGLPSLYITIAFPTVVNTQSLTVTFELVGP